MTDVPHTPEGVYLKTWLRPFLPWLERDDVLACVEYARRLVAHERVAPTT